MTHTAYFDDSGNDPSAPYFVYGGLIAEDRSWSRFTEEWSAELRRYPRTACFKSAHARTPRGEFAGVPEADVHSKVERLAGIANRHIQFSVSCVVDQHALKDFQKRGALPVLAQHPFQHAALAVTLAAHKYACTELGAGRLSFVLDSQKKQEGLASAVYSQLSSAGPRPNRDTFGAFRFCDDRVSVPLQAADLFVWSLQRIVVGASPAYGAVDLVALRWSSLLLDGKPGSGLALNSSNLFQLAVGSLVSKLLSAVCGPPHF